MSSPWSPRSGPSSSPTRRRRPSGPTRPSWAGGVGARLVGFIGAVLARGGPGPAAAALGAHVLGRAAEHGARQWTARSLRPADVLAALPDIWRAWAHAMPVGPPVLTELELPETE